MSRLIADALTLGRMVSRMAHEIAERNSDGGDVVILGVQRGGVRLAARLAANLTGIVGHPVAHGELDVSMHRDDLASRGPAEVHATRLPVDVTGRTVVLVDDVLYTGRTIRAVLDALHSFGRPRRVQLAVLVDRGHRELPIKADFVGKNIPTAPGERIDVQWAEDGRSDGVHLTREGGGA